MTVLELESKLKQEGVDPEAYSVGGGLPNEQYVLSQEPGRRWDVYYSERGLKSGLRTFDNESAACEFFLNWILGDPSTQRKS